MAFTLSNWTCVSTSLSSPELSAPVYPGVNNVVQNAPNLFTYASPTDTVATILAANYFAAQYASLGVGDIILGNGTDSSFSVTVATVSATGVTVTSRANAAGSVTTTSLANNAVTSPKLAANLLQVATVTVAAAAWDTMYTTPVAILPAPGAGLMYIIDKVILNLAYGSAQFTGGGAVALQYGTAAHAAGPLATATEAATDYTAVTANTMFGIAGSLGVGIATSAAINAPVTLSNQTAVFAGGTGGNFTINVYYKVVSAV